MMEIQYRRPDGSFVAIVNGLPYHVTPNDPLFGQAKDAGADAPFEPQPPQLSPSELLSAERAAMVCSRLQGRLVLGEATCAAIDAIAADPLTPWAMRQTIANAIEWRRTSQAMTELGYLLGYTDAQMDELFRAAMTVQV